MDDYGCWWPGVKDVSKMECPCGQGKHYRMHCPNATPEERQEARKAWANKYMKRQKSAKVKLTTIKVYSSKHEAEADGVAILNVQLWLCKIMKLQ